VARLATLSARCSPSSRACSVHPNRTGSGETPTTKPAGGTIGPFEAQNGFANNLILAVVAALAAVALVNTLVVATLERRRVLRLLGRVGATRGQAAAVFAWHALFVTVTGLIAGVAAGAVTLLAVTRAATGSWVPFVPFGPAAGLAGAVAVLTLAAVIIPFLAMPRREPTVVAG
jgi:putative ABC transport system permease protein